MFDVNSVLTNPQSNCTSVDKSPVSGDPETPGAPNLSGKKASATATMLECKQNSDRSEYSSLKGQPNSEGWITYQDVDKGYIFENDEYNSKTSLQCNMSEILAKKYRFPKTDPPPHKNINHFSKAELFCELLNTVYDKLQPEVYQIWQNAIERDPSYPEISRTGEVATDHTLKNQRTLFKQTKKKLQMADFESQFSNDQESKESSNTCVQSSQAVVKSKPTNDSKSLSCHSQESNIRVGESTHECLESTQAIVESKETKESISPHGESTQAKIKANLIKESTLTSKESVQAARESKPRDDNPHPINNANLANMSKSPIETLSHTCREQIMSCLNDLNPANLVTLRRLLRLINSSKNIKKSIRKISTQKPEVNREEIFLSQKT